MDNQITVLIPSSPIKSHPDTAIIDETISTIRGHLPKSEIILQLDGVREEQKDYTNRYNEYKTQVLWKCLHKWKNVLPVVFDEHKHQSGMLHETIDLVKTPLILYVEADTPLTPDRPIDWKKCIDFIYEGKANTIRLHFENVIPKEHEDLMLGNPEQGFLKTIQWSQRPHLSSTVYYRDELLKHFPVTARTMLEDVFHGVVYNDYQNDGMLGWYKHRLWIYYPPEGNIQRSYNLDGRGDDPKYSMVFS